MDDFRLGSSFGSDSTAGNSTKFHIRGRRLLGNLVVLAVYSIGLILLKYRTVLDADSGGNFTNRPGMTGSMPKVSRQHESPFCNRSQLQKGKWIRSNNTPVYDLQNEACYNSAYKATDSYEWEPQDHLSCVFAPWDDSEFCALLKGAPILFVGDSLTFEHYVTLVNTLGGKTSKGLQQISTRRHMTVIQSVCDHQQTFVMFRREDHLRNLDRYLNETFPVVLILNQGAHYKPDEELLSDMQTTLLPVQAWQNQCTDYDIKCHFFWRTSVPGHPNCGTFTEPANDLNLMEDMIANGKSEKSYNWHAFKHQNELILETLENMSSSNLLDYDIIDAYYSNILRPDQHARPLPSAGATVTDCLHSCSPGKVDVYNQFLLHSLLQSRTLDHANELERFHFPWKRRSNVKPDGSDIVPH